MADDNSNRPPVRATSRTTPLGTELAAQYNSSPSRTAMPRNPARKRFARRSKRRPKTSPNCLACDLQNTLGGYMRGKQSNHPRLTARAREVPLGNTVEVQPLKDRLSFLLPSPRVELSSSYQEESGHPGQLRLNKAGRSKTSPNSSMTSRSRSVRGAIFLGTHCGQDSTINPEAHPLTSTDPALCCSADSPGPSEGLVALTKSPVSRLSSEFLVLMPRRKRIHLHRQL
ncbi:hypothetical protein FPOA_11919 [Fusarium poae]|uniref:Uncharacterized protein n=1 Tax=Fusarium poae TaxID=36050 RepID=A0A1B8AI81_FUSPO|nr:hypothetical protein FPOA_11919 [Fusarium poae]